MGKGDKRACGFPPRLAPGYGCVGRCPTLYSTGMSHTGARAEHRVPVESVSGRSNAMADYMYLVQMDIPAALEDEFNWVVRRNG